MSDGLSVFLSKDDKARYLLMSAWVDFWRRHSYGDVALAITEDEIDDLMERAEKIIRGSS